MMYGFGGMGSGMFMLFALGRILLLGLFVYILYRVYKQKSGYSDQALEQLKLKFVNGEIMEEAYLKKIEILRK